MAASSTLRLAPSWSWVILCRVGVPDPDDAPADEITVGLDTPPRFSLLTLPRSVHPDPANYDRQPYIVASDPAGLLLVHLNREPLVGFDFSPEPQGTLVVVREFVPIRRKDAVGTGVRVPGRVDPAMPGISNIKKLGLVSLPGSSGAEYIVGELQVVNGVDKARLFCFRSGDAAWIEKRLQLSCGGMSPEAKNSWRSDDVIAHGGMLWWVSLEWGLLGCNPFDEHPVLHHRRLPEPRELQHVWEGAIERTRCVTVSEDKLRYVEISRAEIDQDGDTAVVMWTLIGDPKPGGLAWWGIEHTTMLRNIWADKSYNQTVLGQDVPVLAVVHPRNSRVIVFFQEQRQLLYAVDMPDCKLVALSAYWDGTPWPYNLPDVGDGPGTRPPPPSWRFVLAWVVPPSVAQARHSFSDEELDESMENVNPVGGYESCDSSASMRIQI